MLKLLEILQNVYLDKILFKSQEYKDGFKRAIDIVKIHGFSTEVIHETKELRSKLEQAVIDISFLQERLQLKKEEIGSLKTKVTNLNVSIQDIIKSDDKKAVKRIKTINKRLLNTTKPLDERVSDVLAYIKSINEFNTLENE